VKSFLTINCSHFDQDDGVQPHLRAASLQHQDLYRLENKSSVAYRIVLEGEHPDTLTSIRNLTYLLKQQEQH
jgi:hypothetical protein